MSESGVQTKTGSSVCVFPDSALGHWTRRWTLNSIQFIDKIWNEKMKLFWDNYFSIGIKIEIDDYNKEKMKAFDAAF